MFGSRINVCVASGFQTVQDLMSVSELLDSCTLVDLGSDLQTSKLLEHFTQARPHFTVSGCWTLLFPWCVVEASF